MDEHTSPGTRIRLYSFVDLLALMAAAELKGRGVSLQHIRSVVKRLRERGYVRPLTELRWATVGRHLYFQDEHGHWEGGLRPDQIVMHQALNLELLRNRILTSAQRDEQTVGHIERRRGALGGKPLLAGTRVPVETIRRYLDAGRTTEQILESFPALTAADLDAVKRDTTVA